MHPTGIFTALALGLPFWAAGIYLAPWLTVAVFGLACVAVGFHAAGFRKAVAL